MGCNFSDSCAECSVGCGLGCDLYDDARREAAYEDDSYDWPSYHSYNHWDVYDDVFDDSPEPTSYVLPENAPEGAVSWLDVRDHLGEYGQVVGPIVATSYSVRQECLYKYYPEAGLTSLPPTYLSMGAEYPDNRCATVVVWGKYRDNFPYAPESLLRGEDVCVKGKPREWNGRIYIDLYDPSQIEILSL